MAMYSVELLVLLFAVAVFAISVVVHTFSRFAQQAAAIRAALAECPEKREFRYTVRETVVSYNDGKVVQLGTRRKIAAVSRQPQRAAA